MQSWQMNQTQREVTQKRADLVTLDEAIARLEAMLAEARDFAAHFEERRRVIRAKLAALHFRRYPVHVDAQGLPLSGPPPAAWAEYDDLIRQEQAVEDEQQRQKDARRVASTDGVLSSTWSPLDPGAVERKLEYARRHRGVAGAALANLESQLSAGEIVQTGQPAPDYVANRDRVAALRERLGTGA